jgi:hypothetical protein
MRGDDGGLEAMRGWAGPAEKPWVFPWGDCPGTASLTIGAC